MNILSQETAFRAELSILLKKQMAQDPERRDFAKFHDTVGVFADWLEEQGSKEAIIARTPFTITGGLKLQSLMFELPVSLLWEKLSIRKRMLFSGTVNSVPILCFEEGTLRLQRPVFISMGLSGVPINHLVFTWMSKRSGRQWYDVGATRDGFYTLFSQQAME